MKLRSFILLFLFFNPSFSYLNSQILEGELKRWHALSLTFDGPNTSESASPNPFADFRMEVTFTHPATERSFTVPGYFAACGNAAENSCTSGDKWRVHFSPEQKGKWNWIASFKAGTDIAIQTGGNSAGFFDGSSGSFDVQESDKTGRDNRSPEKGRLQYINAPYLKYSGINPVNPNGDWFLKAGPDAPENMLSYNDFDEVPTPQKTWQPHQSDYLASDAESYTWAGGKGSEMLGMIRYLSDIKDMNAFSFLTFSLDGDDKTVSPHLTSSGDGKGWNKVHHDRFDISRMDQWEKIFAYADKKGMFLHFKTQETENDQKMDGGNVGRERKLYYRMLIAHFSHHLALNWNLGEENTQTTTQRREMAQFFADHDPYRHLVVIHTYPGQQDQVYDPLLGNDSELTGASIQTGINNVHQEVAKWVAKSAATGKPWIVANDEQGNANIGVHVDPNDRKKVREEVIWGTLMAGGMGFEFYYGYQTGCSDLNCQDHRTRDEKYTDAAYALNFFQEYFMRYLPNVVSADNETSNNSDYLLRNESNTAFAIYLPSGGSTDINGLTGVNNTIRWYNPRNGEMGTSEPLASNSLTAPDNQDWVALVLAGGNTFPVEWLGFTVAQTAIEEIQLDWATALEINNAGFNVERSVDGITFETIAHVAGAGNSSLPQTYSYIDYVESFTELFYRLKQIDIDGNSTYSEIRTIKLNKTFKPEIQLYPNPAKDHMLLRVEADPSKVYKVSILDLVGRKIYEDKYLSRQGEMLISIANINSGIYTLRVSDTLTEEVISTSFVKE